MLPDPFRLFGRLLVFFFKVVGYFLIFMAQSLWYLLHLETGRIGDAFGYLGREIVDALAALVE